MGGRRKALTGRAAAAALCLALAPLGRAAAQGDNSLFERLNLDRLGLTAIGFSFGSVNPTEMVSTQAYTIFADYGEIAPKWRVVFLATYWGTEYTDDAVRAFARQFRTNIQDPSGDDTLRTAGINVSDIAILGELRYTPWRDIPLRPYIGGGMGAHVLNAEGKYISQTFVETALDNIAAGFSGVAGVEAIFGRRVFLGLQARYELLSVTRYASLRVTASYLLSPQRPVRQ